MIRELLINLKNEPCMRQNWELEVNNSNLLKEEFPSLFGENTISISVPNGWEDIIWNFCRYLYNKNSVMNRQVTIAQIKQKLGGLRIYLNSGADEEDYKVAEEAMNQAAYICEFCGSNEEVELFYEGYISNSCLDCREKISLYWFLIQSYEGDLAESRKLNPEYNKILRKAING